MLFIYITVSLLAASAIIVLFALTPTSDVMKSAFSPQSDSALERARSLAKACANSSEAGNGVSLREATRYIEQACALVIRKNRSGDKLSRPEEVLFDAYYQVNELSERAKSGARALKGLPCYLGFPVVYLLASEIVRSGRGVVEKSCVKELVQEFNAYRPLSSREALALPAAIDAALLAHVANFSKRLLATETSERVAIEDGSLGRVDVSHIDSSAYITTLYATANHKLKREIAALCLDNGVDVQTTSENYRVNLLEISTALTAAFSCVRDMTEWLTCEFCLTLAPVHAFLEKESDVYAQSATESKQTYLAALSEKAMRARKSEFSTARKLVASSSGDPLATLLPKKKSKLVQRAFIAAILLTATLIAAFIALSLRSIAAAVLTLPALISSVFLLVCAASTRSTEKRILPKKALKYIGNDKRVNVVCPRLIASAEEVTDAVKNLSAIALLHTSARYSFTLLVDFCAADEQETLFDAQPLRELEREFSELPDNFNLLIRNRSLNSKGKWEGREKKRGALLDYMALALHGDRAPFRVVRGSSFSADYALVVDSDTLLSCGDELLQIMEHPHNASVNALSLHVSALPLSAERTLFSRIFSSAKGLSPYSAHHDDFIFDAFGSGNFTGKGMLRVKAFYKLTESAFPPERILSHDFIEGAFSGAAQSDEQALEDVPHTFFAHFTRSLRWLRGDVQLFPYLFKTVKNARLERVKNPLSPIDKWHIFYNILSGILPVASLSLLFLALIQADERLLVLAALPYLTQVLLAPKSVLAVLCKLAFLPVEAAYNAYNIALTAVRLIRGKNLLEWQVFAHQKKQGELTPLPCSVTAFVLLLLNLFLFSSYFIYGACALFVLAIPLEGLLGSERTKKSVPTAERDFLAFTTTRTWEYFKQGCNAEANYLPPDNYSEDGERGFAYRTSPTNIGMAIVAAYSAAKTGVITPNEARGVISNIIDTVTRLEKWQGNLYNWYDVKTLEVLYPRYVSSVDSGNFLCALYLALTFADREDKAKIGKLINETRLSAFYDGEKRLMRIGYVGTENRFDTGCYDLVASEASTLYLLAISRGEISKHSWFTLTRRAVYYGGSTFYSWTGGVFEQLFCPLFFELSSLSTAERSCKAMLAAQVKYAKKHDLPVWGISESGYNEKNEVGDYKYKAWGVPEIALSDYGRGRVVAPYASALALGRNASAVSNLYAFTELGMSGRMGLYEALDGVPVKSYMAHHQGMIMAAICNYLADGAIVKALENLPVFTAAQLLLSDCGKLKGNKKPVLGKRKKVLPEAISVRGEHAFPTLGTFGRRKYTFTIDEHGNGGSRYNDDTVLRERKNEGFKAFVCGKCVTDGAEAEFSARGVTFTKKEDGLACYFRVGALMRVAGEVRTLTVTNCTSEEKRVALAVIAQPVLCLHDADAAHREYGNMFVSTHDMGMGVSAERKGGKTFCALTALGDKLSFSYGGNRASFYGRRKGLIFGETLDPALTATCEFTLLGGQSVTAEYYLVVADSYDRVQENVSLIRTHAVYRQTDDSGAACSPSVFALAGRIASASSCVKDARFAERFDARYPLLAFSLPSVRSAERLKAIFADLKIIARCGIRFHLAVLFEEARGYLSPLSDVAFSLIEESGLRKLMPPSLALLAINRAADSDLYDLALNNSLDLRADNPELEFPLQSVQAPFPLAPLKSPTLTVTHGKNGFTAEGGYFIDVSDGLPPKPWSNVLSNGNFGTLMTESGGGYTFLRNAGLERVTEWTNDSTLDAPSEFILLSERGNVWSITRNPVQKQANYHVLHNFGYTKYACNYNGFTSSLTCFIGRAAAKYYLVELENAVPSPRSVSVTLGCAITLGDFSERTKTCVTTGKEENVLYARNEVNGCKILLDCTEKIGERSFSLRSLGNGSALRASDYTCIEGTDLVYTVNVNVPPNGKKRVVFCFTETEKYDFSIVDELLDYNYRKYSSLSSVQMESDDLELNYLYKWLPYQTECARFNGRTGFYQSSGAYGFRDQLQDCLSLLYVDPVKVRKHILKCAKAQFESGDVLHWWHEGKGGVRTLISDDRLFLPWAVSEYVRFTGDVALLTERAEYLRAEPIPSGSRSLYKVFEKSEITESVLKHCLRAIRSVELSHNGIPLIKGGDWNDAIDEAGVNGKGESVFLGMLLCLVIKRFSRFVTSKEDKNELLNIYEQVKEALDERWTGDRYERAVTDDGRVLGNESSPECKIDLLTQAFAVISGACEREKAEKAVDTAWEKLVDEENGIIKLLDPPFEKLKVGYIANYPKGIRENGGQYTHVAVWFIAALYELGRDEQAFKALKTISPSTHARSNVYGLEPYVLAADVYSGEHAGEGGWSWYTGAAGWAYKVITEKMLGVKIRKNTLTLQPQLPRSVKKLTLTVTIQGNTAKIDVDNTGSGEWTLYVGKVRYSVNSLDVTARTRYESITLKKE